MKKLKVSCNAEKLYWKVIFENAVRQAYIALVWVTSNVRRQLFRRDSGFLDGNFDFSEVSEQINEDIADAIETALSQYGMKFHPN
ncbi:MAG: hypothetical protein IPL28_03345 [Chloroflexi bacterium]|nr:hypothetical protein [Chloroflexota bacterium]